MNMIRRKRALAISVSFVLFLTVSLAYSNCSDVRVDQLDQISAVKCLESGELGNFAVSGQDCCAGLVKCDQNNGHFTCGNACEEVPPIPPPTPPPPQSPPPIPPPGVSVVGTPSAPKPGGLIDSNSGYTFIPDSAMPAVFYRNDVPHFAFGVSDYGNRGYTCSSAGESYACANILLAKFVDGALAKVSQTLVNWTTDFNNHGSSGNNLTATRDGQYLRLASSLANTGAIFLRLTGDMTYKPVVAEGSQRAILPIHQLGTHFYVLDNYVYSGPGRVYLHDSSSILNLPTLNDPPSDSELPASPVSPGNEIKIHDSVDGFTAETPNGCLASQKWFVAADVQTTPTRVLRISALDPLSTSSYSASLDLGSYTTKGIYAVLCSSSSEVIGSKTNHFVSTLWTSQDANLKLIGEWLIIRLTEETGSLRSAEILKSLPLDNFLSGYTAGLANGTWLDKVTVPMFVGYGREGLITWTAKQPGTTAIVPLILNAKVNSIGVSNSGAGVVSVMSNSKSYLYFLGSSAVGGNENVVQISIPP